MALSRTTTSKMKITLESIAYEMKDEKIQRTVNATFQCGLFGDVPPSLEELLLQVNECAIDGYEWSLSENMGIEHPFDEVEYDDHVEMVPIAEEIPDDGTMKIDITYTRWARIKDFPGDSINLIEHLVNMGKIEKDKFEKTEFERSEFGVF